MIEEEVKEAQIVVELEDQEIAAPVLIIDDEDMNVIILREILAEKKIKSDSAYSGAQALEKV